MMQEEGSQLVANFGWVEPVSLGREKITSLVSKVVKLQEGGFPGVCV
jgi:hypothetical protein